MDSIQWKFVKNQKNHPFWSSYICFAQAILGNGYSSRVISYWFKKLVDKEDYNPKDKKELLKHLKSG